MGQPLEITRVDDLWFEEDPDALFCCFCKLKIGSAALARTFRVPHPSEDNSYVGHAKTIRTFTGTIIVFDRHLQCLLQSGIKYSAISHVWDPDISQLQCRGRHEPQPLELCRRLVQLPLLIYHGLLKSSEISELDEIWHDYISVPQWSDEIKNKILLAIPDIYKSAYVTTVHLEDLQKESVRMLYEGQTTDERLKGITDICNDKWFTRVWTAMEFVQSRRVVSLNGDYEVGHERNDPLYLTQMNRVWNNELRKHDSVHHLEHEARIGKNIVPWNLGPLEEMGKRNSSTFGQAFSLLSKRRCRTYHDFLYALLGLVEPTSDRPLENDFAREYTRIAKLCLAIGDYSPILMTPPLEDPNDAWRIIQGFNDVSIWPLGAGLRLSDFHQDFSFQNGDLEYGDPVFKLQQIGVVSQVYERQRGTDSRKTHSMADFALDASIVSKTTGPDLDSFIDTLGWRLYDEEVDFIKRQLVVEGQSDKLASILQKRHNEGLQGSWPIEGPEGAEWLADAMTLSRPDPKGLSNNPISRLAWLNAHGGTIHAGYVCGNCLLSVPCVVCHRMFIFRAGLFERPSNVQGSIAYRIPGLRYYFSHPNGVGIVVKNGRVVGRMVWATPACDCSEIKKVDIKMPNLPDPDPRPLPDSASFATLMSLSGRGHFL